jgi:ketosteroid isomerase-like protein
MPHDDVAAVKAVIEDRLSAIRERDAARANATLAPDIVAFELVPPLALAPGEARDAAAMAAWFATWEGPIDIDMSDLDVAASGDVAFARALHRLSGTRAGTGVVRLWLRSTLCFRKRGGHWLIVHSHSSVPFRPEEGMRAALDLQP